MPQITDPERIPSLEELRDIAVAFVDIIKTMRENFLVAGTDPPVELPTEQAFLPVLRSLARVNRWFNSHRLLFPDGAGRFPELSGWPFTVSIRLVQLKKLHVRIMTKWNLPRLADEKLHPTHESDKDIVLGVDWPPQTESSVIDAMEEAVVELVKAFEPALQARTMPVGTNPADAAAEQVLQLVLIPALVTTEGAGRAAADGEKGQVPRPEAAESGIDEQTETGSVVLCGPQNVPVVNGKRKRQLSASAYSLVAKLIRAGAEGLTKDEMESRHSGARRTLNRLLKDADWALAIKMPGRSGRRYRIL